MLKLAAVFAFFLTAAVAGPLYNEEDDTYGRILGGLTATNGQFPYQISLRSPQNQHFCGGSVINANWILTAAHCVYGKSASSMMIVVGTNLLNSGGTGYGVIQVIWHEGYSPQNNVNDIAVLRVAGSISYNSQVQAINLANSATHSGASCTLSGWGLSSYPSNNLPNRLQYITLYAISTAQCQNAMPGFPVYNTNLCTYVGYGRGACQGDSGGPLTSNGVQVGVVSWGIPCAKGKPDIFTSVAAYRGWIKATTGI